MRMTSTLAAFGACAALSGLAPPAGAQTVQPMRHFAAATAVDCKRPRDTQIFASDASDQTSSTVWVNLTDGLVSFTSTRVGCVIATLSGTASANNEIMFVRAVLDGTTTCAPSSLNSQIFVGDEYIGTTHSMTWLCASVAVGAHALQMQYESYFGDAVTFSGHTLTVMHN
jgi:hypothetical protein